MNMYVSNLSFNTGEEELNELFSAFGEVSSVKIILDRETGRSRGFGFVEMNSRDDAEKAMAALHNKEIEGRALSVSEARPKPAGDRGFQSRGRSGGSRW
jgi:RNA recognition motif-containing protein